MLVYFFGEQAQAFIEKRLELVFIGFLVLVVLGFVAGEISCFDVHGVRRNPALL